TSPAITIGIFLLAQSLALMEDRAVEHVRSAGVNFPCPMTPQLWRHAYHAEKPACPLARAGGRGGLAAVHPAVYSPTLLLDATAWPAAAGRFRFGPGSLHHAGAETPRVHLRSRQELPQLVADDHLQ